MTGLCCLVIGMGGHVTGMDSSINSMSSHVTGREEESESCDWNGRSCD